MNYKTNPYELIKRRQRRTRWLEALIITMGVLTMVFVWRLPTPLIIVVGVLYVLSWIMTIAMYSDEMFTREFYKGRSRNNVIALITLLVGGPYLMIPAIIVDTVTKAVNKRKRS